MAYDRSVNIQPGEIYVSENLEQGPAPGESGPATASASASASASSASAAAQLVPGSVGEQIDLLGAYLTIEGAYHKNGIHNYLDHFSGHFIVVEFTYEYLGGGPVMLEEPVATLMDAGGTRYQYHYDATSSLGIIQKRDLLFAEINPNVPEPGLLVFEMPENAEGPYLLRMRDLANPQNAQAEISLDI